MAEQNRTNDVRVAGKRHDRDTLTLGRVYQDLKTSTRLALWLSIAVVLLPPWTLWKLTVPFSFLCGYWIAVAVEALAGFKVATFLRRSFRAASKWLLRRVIQFRRDSASKLSVQITGITIVAIWSLVVIISVSEQGAALTQKGAIFEVLDWLRTLEAQVTVALTAPIAAAIGKVVLQRKIRDEDARSIQMLEALSEARRNCAHALHQSLERCFARPRPFAEYRREAIKAIAEGVLDAFFAITDEQGGGKKGQLKVAIYGVENEQITERLDWAPASAEFHTSIETIRSTKSAAMRCVATRQIIIIPDIALDVAGRHPKYLTCDRNPDGAKGSLICFPVRDTRSGKVLFVVCVQDQTDHSLVAENREFYEREFATYRAELLEADILASREQGSAPENFQPKAARNGQGNAGSSSSKTDPQLAKVEDEGAVSD